MSDALGDCSCGCGGGLQGCNHLRVTAVKRWNGYYPWNKGFGDVVEKKYRKITVTRILHVNGQYDATIQCRPATEEEQAAGYGYVSYICPYPGAPGATAITLYTDLYGNPINFEWQHPTFIRTEVCAIEPYDAEHPANGGYECASSGPVLNKNWPPDYMADGINRAPKQNPDTILVTGSCVDYIRSASGSGKGACVGAVCPNECVDHQKNFDHVPAPGSPCPPIEPPWTCAGGANGYNLAEWAFNGIVFNETHVTERTISGDGLTLTVHYLEPLNGDTLQVIAVLSDEYSVTTALGEAETLLARVAVDRGNSYWSCGGAAVLGCGTGQTARLGITEDAVCGGGVRAQDFCATAESALLEDVPDHLLAQKVWFDTLVGGQASGLVVVSKSRIQRGAAMEFCTQAATHPSNNFEVVYGSVTDCATGAGEVLVDVGAAPTWGRRMYT